MLSILVPIFNHDVTKLISSLHNQASNLGVQFEILCIDDGSKASIKKVNGLICNHKYCIYEELQENIGRARIRNLLARKAKFENLLFLDCDSEIHQKEFIQTYISSLQSFEVVCGGTRYRNQPPQNKELILRWRYGIAREQVELISRKKSPYRYFFPNNFAIKKKLYVSIKMNEDLIQYGHEDTLFSKELKDRNLNILHINNPVIHIGLETASVFLYKTEMAVSNLSSLVNKNLLGNEVKLVATYIALKRFGLINITNYMLNLLCGLFLLNLKSANPRLFLLDFYKLKLFIEASKQ